MAKVNDTLKFTDATTQANEKTPQETMAEEAAQKLKPLCNKAPAKKNKRWINELLYSNRLPKNPKRFKPP